MTMNYRFAFQLVTMLSFGCRSDLQYTYTLTEQPGVKCFAQGNIGIVHGSTLGGFEPITVLLTEQILSHYNILWVTQGQILDYKA